MIHNSINRLYVTKKHIISLLFILTVSIFPVLAQINYVPMDEFRDAGMGVERVSRFFTPAYASKPAQKDDETRWVQIDLGEREKFDGIKLLPRIQTWGYVTSVGFPSRFKIEVSDDPEFKNAVIYENSLREDFRDPGDEVCTFSGKEVPGRYVRLTATRLRQKVLALTKFMVMSDGKDIAQGCSASDSESGNLGAENLLTRLPRPQGEGVVTDNPDNIIPESKWNPVAYKAETPKKGVELREGLFKKTMENNISYLMSSFTFDELVRNFRVKAGKPVQPLEERLYNFWFVDLHRKTCELCGSIFWAFLNQRFHLLNPEEEKYVAEIEKSIYNNLIANQVGATGIRYHAVLADHKDLNNSQPFSMSTCCEGRGTRMIGALPEFIYSIANDGVYVDLFASSTIKFKIETGEMSLKMVTHFPYDKKVQLSVNTNKPLNSKIRIRVPSWASREMTVMVNCKKTVSGKPGTYVTISREWKTGDIISFTLPMDFRMTTYTGVERDPKHEQYALEYGPILMAYTSMNGQKNNLTLPIRAEKLIKSLKPVADKSLHFYCQWEHRLRIYAISGGSG